MPQIIHLPRFRAERAYQSNKRSQTFWQRTKIHPYYDNIKKLKKG